MFILTVTESGHVTRLVFGCEQPALNIKRALEQAAYTVSLTEGAEPKRSPKEKARALTMVRYAFEGERVPLPFDNAGADRLLEALFSKK